MDETSKALNAYRDAVARRAYWENHGRRGDGNLEEAQREEKKARRAVVNAISTTIAKEINS